VTKIPSNPATNNYYSLSTFRSAKERTTSNFSKLYVLALDDMEELKAIQPTYKLETSPNNYQIGIKLDPPVSDLGIARRLVSSLAKKFAGEADTSGNNIVRWIRLPVGVNGKYSPPVACSLVEWRPDVSYSYHDVIKALDLDGKYINEGFSKEKGGSSSYPKDLEQIRAVLSHISPDGYQEWLNVGMALRNSYPDDDDVLEVYEEWSSGTEADNFNKGETCADVYKKPPSSGGITFGSIVYAAKENGYEFKPPSVKHLLDEPFENPININVTVNKPKSKADLLKNFEFVDIDENDRKATDWVIDGFLAEGIGTIAGGGGAGKTSLLIPLCARIAHLIKDEFTPAIRRKIIYITEDLKQVQAILQGLAKQGVDQEERKEWFKFIQAKMLKAEDYALLASEVAPSLFNGEFEPLVVFDTLSATVNVTDENDNNEIKKAIELLKSEFSNRNIPIWLVAHIAKAARGESENISARGAGAFGDNAMFSAQIIRDGEFTYFRTGKARPVKGTVSVPLNFLIRTA